MKCLVVLAHPVKESLCHYLYDQTVSHLAEKGYEITKLDLYENEFSPVLTTEERSSYYGAKFDSSSVEKEITLLKEAESLVLVYPTWWFSFPAILKGWFDRVWAPGHAYDHDKELGAIKPRLDNLKEVKVVTTLGAPWWVDNLVLWKPVQRVLKIALLGACAKKCSLTYLSLYKSENVSKAKVDAFVEKIKARF
ncbi:NAD(P)H-dependent oxidoreductase [Vibrio sonorensis]|uniref:NAD(P)H-dependent oxidoreductase n=1 Tax=Vibrio sonorensis TaxID=1004316 RepID=UPI0008D9C7B6|nr:NAD(P)H-dependent oxidoreductase [Vibrio sonorensis]